jgi:hypothetical protein
VEDCGGIKRRFPSGVTNRTTGGVDRFRFETASDILPKSFEDGIDPVMHQGASWFDGVVK